MFGTSLACNSFKLELGTFHLGSIDVLLGDLGFLEELVHFSLVSRYFASFRKQFVNGLVDIGDLVQVSLGVISGTSRLT